MNILLFAVIGWCLGAGINYLADTLPWKRRLSKPFCTNCQEEMTWQNYLLWPRTCSTCQSRRDWGVFVVELFFIVTIPIMWLFPPNKLGFWLGLPLVVYFALVVVIDLRYKLILHIVSIVGAMLGLFVGISINGLKSTLLGGVIGFGVMFCFYKLGELFIRFISRRRGNLDDDVALGFGDVNLSGVLGLMVGFPGVVVSLFFGALIGGFFSLLYLIFSFLLRKYKPLTALPYGPFLISGAVLVLFFIGLLDRMF